MGIRRYLKGKEPSLQLRREATRVASSGGAPTTRTSLFEKLILRPESSLKQRSKKIEISEALVKFLHQNDGIIRVLQMRNTRGYEMRDYWCNMATSSHTIKDARKGISHKIEKKGRDGVPLPKAPTFLK